VPITLPITLSAINRFPVKSCRGEAMSTATVEPWGLAGDRRWMLVDDTGETVTAREVPRLLLIEPALTEHGLRVIAPGRAPLDVHRPSVPDTEVSVFHRAPVTACLAAEGAHEWFSETLGTPVRLVYQDDPTRRRTNPAHSTPGDCASFQDGYPFSLASAASLAALNELIVARGGAPVPMRRFRPNLVLSGAPAWDEDQWRRLRIGDAVFRLVKGIDRCVITTTDPDTAEVDRACKEPLRTLAKHRRFDGASWFAVHLAPDTPGAIIRVGDVAEVLDREESDGPPR
jgi:uncharacterized protein YcbX